MGGSNLAARFLVLAFFVVVGAGFYAVALKSNLSAAEVQLNTIAKDRDLYKTRLEQYASQSKSDSQAIANLQAQVADLSAQLESMKAKPAGRR
jgi:NADH dehydrogenase FAD-containing subunit